MAFLNADLPAILSFPAEPYDFTFPPQNTALLVIDMQRDFLVKGGFGELEGGDLTAVQAAIAPVQKLLDVFRKIGLTVFHTREGHRPDLSDCPSSKLVRQAAAPGNTQHTKVIRESARMGRLLVRGEYGHNFVDELQPWPDEEVIDKSGRGAFYNTELFDKLKARDITHIIMSGVTTECCFTSTIREANDRGFECCAIEETTAGYDETFKKCSLEMLHWSQGLFGFVGHLQPLLGSLESYLNSGTGLGQDVPLFDGNLNIASLRRAYRKGLPLTTVMREVMRRVEDYHRRDPAVWVFRESRLAISQRVAKIQDQWPNVERRPVLFGIPFSVKDNMDVEGLATTTACLPMARDASRTAPCVSHLLTHGAVFIGKTNMEQLATGMTGCRSPFGYPKSVYHHDYTAGGSSSGSCVSVGAGLVSFSLGSDTAGSGRLPAAFNGVTGFKPTKGLISTVGITPACRSLDTVAIIARSVHDTREVWNAISSYDPTDPLSKQRPNPIPRHINATGPQRHAFTFGIPPSDVLAACHPAYQRAFTRAVDLLKTIGGTQTPHPISWTIFRKAGQLIYEGALAFERLSILPSPAATFLTNNPPPSLHPVIHTTFTDILTRASQTSPADIFRDIHAQAEYTRLVHENVFACNDKAGVVDVIITPTAPTHFTFAEVERDPIGTNAHLGIFAHSANVLDLCGVAVPAGTVTVGEMRREGGAAAAEEHKGHDVTAESEGGKIEGGLGVTGKASDGDGDGDGDGGDEDKDDEAVLPFGVTFLSGSRMDAEVLRIAERFDQAVRDRKLV